MKNILNMAVLALVGAVMTGCSNDDNFAFHSHGSQSWGAPGACKSGAWYKILDPQGKTLKTMSEQTLGTVISVSGNTFTSRSGNKI